LECREVPLLRRFLQVAQHPEDVFAPRLPQQPLVHFAVGDLGSHPRLAGRLQAGVTLCLAWPGISPNFFPYAA